MWFQRVSLWNRLPLTKVSNRGPSPIEGLENTRQITESPGSSCPNQPLLINYRPHTSVCVPVSSFSLDSVLTLAQSVPQLFVSAASDLEQMAGCSEAPWVQGKPCSLFGAGTANEGVHFDHSWLCVPGSGLQPVDSLTGTTTLRRAGLSHKERAAWRRAGFINQDDLVRLHLHWLWARGLHAAECLLWKLTF